MLQPLVQNRIDIEQSDVLQLKKGDRRVFNHVFQCYSRRLYYFSLGYLKSERDAEEIVQDTFLKLWERRESVNPELSLQAYVFKIAFNFIQKKLERNIKDNALKHQLAGELVHFDNHTDDLVNYHFLIQQINWLIDELPPRQKEVIELRKLEGYSTKEIAEKLSLSIKTVEAHLTAAMKYLKANLKDENLDNLLLFVLTFRKNIQLD